jgi:hypothetical protein
MEKYYYDFDSITKTCKTECKYWNEKELKWDRKIGSAKCKKCDFCKGFDDEENWIKCDKLKEALG